MTYNEDAAFCGFEASGEACHLDAYDFIAALVDFGVVDRYEWMRVYAAHQLCGERVGIRYFPINTVSRIFRLLRQGYGAESL